MPYASSRGGRLPLGVVLLLLAGSMCGAGAMGGEPPQPVDAAPSGRSTQPLMQLRPGDTVSIAVFEQPDLNSTVYVGDDGTLPVALAGAVHVAGLTPAAAGQTIATALRDGKFLVDPHVTVTVVSAYNQ